MHSQDPPIGQSAVHSAPFMPLAFRLAAAFGLIALHLALPGETTVGMAGEGFYLACLALLFAECVWEALRSNAQGRAPFGTPSARWIRFNILLDIALVTLVITFQGVAEAQLATLYIFPVLASAFYLNIIEIVVVAVISSVFHITSVLLFISGILPVFGRSSPGFGLDPSQTTFILGFASLQIFAAALVVVVIRKHLESLRQDLSKSESAVGELSHLYQQVFESMLSGLITVDLRGRITSANRAARSILRRPLAPGTPIEAQGFGPLSDLGSRLQEERFELAVETPEGTSRTIGGNLVVLFGPDQQASGHLVVFQDLTQLKALQERTRVSERLAAVGELSSEMAHELRNPMASILGCVQILRQGEQPRPMVDRVLTILGRESERVSALVTDFLDFSRPRPMRMQTIRLPEIEEEVRANWETDVRNAGLTLAAGVPPDVWVLGDASWVHQVFSNLLSNARKALKGVVRPTIRLTYQLRPGRVLVSVCDNGCGMTEERRRLIFIPFACGFEEGTGLGMSLVFQFVQQMGWDIEVTSAPGQGTTVSLLIPLHPGTLPPPAAHHE